MKLDEIDSILIGLCKDKPGRRLSDLISNFLEILPVGLPLLGEKAIRDRLDRLNEAGFLRLDRDTLKRRVFCQPTKLGEEYLAGRMEEPASKEVSPS